MIGHQCGNAIVQDTQKRTQNFVAVIAYLRKVLVILEKIYAIILLAVEIAARRSYYG